MDKHTQKGFTLLELTLVLFILTLVLAGTLAPLSTLIEGKQRAEAEEELELIRESLIGFAMIHGYLPCPTTEDDPSSDDYGVEDETCSANDAEADGYLPWRTLGIQEIDPWGLTRSAADNPFNGYWRYRVDRNFSNSTAPFTLNTEKGDNITIASGGSSSLLTSPSESPVAVIYSTGANFKQDGENEDYEPKKCGNASGYNHAGANTACPHGGPLYQGGSAIGTGADATFDDIVIWLSRPLLFNRMVTVGRLP